MKSNQSSLTAEGIALIRAFESQKPAGERVCYDPLAIRFLSPWMKRMMKFFVFYGGRRSPGVMEYLISRTRYIDDYLQERLDHGAKQLAILGAGFDSRAYRYADLPGKVKVYEVDHPATQAVKLAKLKQMFGEVPAHVTLVPIDFDHENLEKLLDVGYKPDLETLFIWEGVTYYLTSDAVDQTLDFIHRKSAPGSAVIFDYVSKAAIAGKLSRNELKSMRRYAGITGENIQFGLDEGEMENFLGARGFDQVVNADSAFFKHTYYQDKLPVAPVYRIVHATVKA